MIRVYFAGPISKGGLAHNIKRATDIAYAFAKLGYAIMVPHLTCYFDGPDDWCEPDCKKNYVGDRCFTKEGVIPKAEGRLTWHEWLAIDLAWVEVSDVVIRILGDSIGAERETAHAERLGIPVYYVNTVDDVALVHSQIQLNEGVAV